MIMFNVNKLKIKKYNKTKSVCKLCCFVNEL